MSLAGACMKGKAAQIARALVIRDEVWYGLWGFGSTRPTMMIHALLRCVEVVRGGRGRRW